MNIITKSAIIDNNIEVVKFCLKSGANVGDNIADVISTAVEFNSIEILTYFTINNDSPTTIYNMVLLAAVKHDNGDIITKYCNTLNYPSNSTCGIEWASILNISRTLGRTCAYKALDNYAKKMNVRVYTFNVNCYKQASDPINLANKHNNEVDEVLAQLISAEEENTYLKDIAKQNAIDHQNTIKELKTVQDKIISKLVADNKAQAEQLKVNQAKIDKIKTFF